MDVKRWARLMRDYRLLVHVMLILTMNREMHAGRYTKHTSIVTLEGSGSVIYQPHAVADAAWTHGDTDIMYRHPPYRTIS